MSGLIRNLLLALGLAVILYLGYVVFIQTDDAATSVSGAATSEALLSAQEFLATLQQLKAIELKGDVLSDPRFTSLDDIRKPDIPEDAGRENPFLPVNPKKK